MKVWVGIAGYHEDDELIENVGALSESRGFTTRFGTRGILEAS